MEKFSRFRDSGTGIQVFLTPVPPSSGLGGSVSSSSPLAYIARLPGYIVGTARLVVLAALSLIWGLFFLIVGAIAGRRAQAGVHAAFGQLALFAMGFSLVRTEVVSLRTRGRAAGASSSGTTAAAWRPKGGDVVLCNFTSWVDLLIALVKFDPRFTIPVVSRGSASAASIAPSATASSMARRRNAGASVVTELNNANSLRSAGQNSSSATREERNLLGFKPVSFLTAVRHVGYGPLVEGDAEAQGYTDLASLCSTHAPLGRPLLVFPELVTSNNRGLLQTSGPPALFPASWRDIYRATGQLRIGKGQPDLWIMSLKHDAPSHPFVRTSATLSVPAARSRTWNPLPHLFALCSDFTIARGVQVRLLEPSESPTSPSYQSSQQSPGQVGANRDTDALAEAVGGLISSMSRLKRTGLGWQDKEAFLEMYFGSAATVRKQQQQQQARP